MTGVGIIICVIVYSRVGAILEVSIPCVGPGYTEIKFGNVGGTIGYGYANYVSVFPITVVLLSREEYLAHPIVPRVNITI